MFVASFDYMRGYVAAVLGDGATYAETLQDDGTVLCEVTGVDGDTRRVRSAETELNSARERVRSRLRIKDDSDTARAVFDSSMKVLGTPACWDDLSADVQDRWVTTAKALLAAGA